MKKASFSTIYSSPCGTKSVTVRGSVTLKDDNKVSISIEDRKYVYYKAVWKAEDTAKAIVAADFNHPAIIGEVQSSNSGILGLLMSETAQLKADLMTRTEKFAKQSFEYISNNRPAMKEKLNQAWDAYRAACAEKQPTWNLQKEYYSIQKKVDTMNDIVNNGLEAYVANQLKNAEAHYTSSLLKLAMKITQKGMDMTNFKLVSGYVGVNLEMNMTDGVQSVKAWTIWAAEDSVLVTPHYRYLVK